MNEKYNELRLPGMSEAEMLRSLGIDGIVDHILDLGARGTEIEKKMNEASDILESAYGLTVEDVLRQREERSRSMHPSLFDGRENQNGEEQ